MRGAQVEAGSQVAPGRMRCHLNKGRWKDVGGAEKSLDGAWTRQEQEMDAGLSPGPAHLHAELPNLQLQPPHLGLPLSHHGLQLGDQAAALLSLIVELLVQAVLGGSCLFLLQTQAAQNLLQLLQLDLGGRAGGQARVSHGPWVRKEKG